MEKTTHQRPAVLTNMMREKETGTFGSVAVTSSVFSILLPVHWVFGGPSND